MNLFPPNVDAIAINVQLGDTVAFSSMFEASDLDGNPIQTLRFRDNNAAATSGYFSVRGVRQESNLFIEVASSELAFIQYHSGLIESNETFSVQVGDGERFSQIDVALANTIRQNFFAPTVNPIDRSVLSTEQIEASSLFTITDPENNAILRYFFVDRTTNDNGGHFLLNGVRQTSGTFFLVQADQLQDLHYVGGRFGQTEEIGITAFDGEFWSEIVDANLTTTPNLNAPVIDVFNVNSGLGKSIAASSLFSYSDADGNSMKTIGFLDTGTASDSGFFTINGVRQDAGTFFTINANQLNTVRYEVSESSDSEIFRVFVGDGGFASTVQSGTVTAIPRPRIDVDNFTVIVDSLEKVDFVDLVTQVDNGQALENFQVIDQNTAFGSARLFLSGERLEQGIIHTLTAVEFANLQIEGSVSDDRSFDQFLVRGSNALFFTDWQEFSVNTDPVGPLALPSGADFSDQFFNGEKHVITWSFIDGLQDGDDPHRPPLPNYYADDDDEATNTRPLNLSMRADIREMLLSVEQFVDIEFQEVPYTLDATASTLLFGMFSGDQTESAHAFLPDGGTGRGSRPGDIWFDLNDFNIGDQGGPPAPVGPGSFFRFVALHELGHALGFKHSFDAPLALPQPVDRADLTVMSYDPSTTVLGSASTFMLWDIQALQQIYGANQEYNLGDDHYFFQPETAALQTLWDAGGRDTINYTNNVNAEFIDLNQGAFSSVQGVPRNLSIAYGTEIENARGGGGADTIIGNSGRNLLFGNGNADILEGNGGNDVFRGGAGGDTYIWLTGDGRDRIDEQQLGGVDAIHLFDDTALNSLENDLVFRRFGRELRIDLRFDQNEAQGSILVKNQQLGGSRIETLRLFNTNGDQIGQDIDLDSIFQQADTTATFFRLTSQQTEFGFIAVPFNA